MTRFEVILNKATILDNNHVKPFEIVEADLFLVENGLVQFIKTQIAKFEDQFTKTALQAIVHNKQVVSYNINSIIKINRLD